MHTERPSCVLTVVVDFTTSHDAAADERPLLGNACCCPVGCLLFARMQHDVTRGSMTSAFDVTPNDVIL